MVRSTVVTSRKRRGVNSEVRELQNDFKRSKVDKSSPENAQKSTPNCSNNESFYFKLKSPMLTVKSKLALVESALAKSEADLAIPFKYNLLVDTLSSFLNVAKLKPSDHGIDCDDYEKIWQLLSQIMTSPDARMSILDFRANFGHIIGNALIIVMGLEKIRMKLLFGYIFGVLNGIFQMGKESLVFCPRDNGFGILPDLVVFIANAQAVMGSDDFLSSSLEPMAYCVNLLQTKLSRSVQEEKRVQELFANFSSNVTVLVHYQLEVERMKFVSQNNFGTLCRRILFSPALRDRWIDFCKSHEDPALGTRFVPFSRAIQRLGDSTSAATPPKSVAGPQLTSIVAWCHQAYGGQCTGVGLLVCQKMTSMMTLVSRDTSNDALDPIHWLLPVFEWAALTLAVYVANGPHAAQNRSWLGNVVQVALSVSKKSPTAFKLMRLIFKLEPDLVYESPSRLQQCIVATHSVDDTMHTQEACATAVFIAETLVRLRRTAEFVSSCLESGILYPAETLALKRDFRDHLSAQQVTELLELLIQRVKSVSGPEMMITLNTFLACILESNKHVLHNGSDVLKGVRRYRKRLVKRLAKYELTVRQTISLKHSLSKLDFDFDMLQTMTEYYGVGYDDDATESPVVLPDILLELNDDASELEVKAFQLIDAIIGAYRILAGGIDHQERCQADGVCRVLSTRALTSHHCHDTPDLCFLKSTSVDAILVDCCPVLDFWQHFFDILPNLSALSGPKVYKTMAKFLTRLCFSNDSCTEKHCMHENLTRRVLGKSRLTPLQFNDREWLSTLVTVGVERIKHWLDLTLVEQSEDLRSQFQKLAEFSEEVYISFTERLMTFLQLLMDEIRRDNVSETCPDSAFSFLIDCYFYFPFKPVSSDFNSTLADCLVSIRNGDLDKKFTQKVPLEQLVNVVVPRLDSNDLTASCTQLKLLLRIIHAHAIICAGNEADFFELVERSLSFSTKPVYNRHLAVEICSELVEVLSKSRDLVESHRKSLKLMSKVLSVELPSDVETCSRWLQTLASTVFRLAPLRNDEDFYTATRSLLCDKLPHLLKSKSVCADAKLNLLNSVVVAYIMLHKTPNLVGFENIFDFQHFVLDCICHANSVDSADKFLAQNERLLKCIASFDFDKSILPFLQKAVGSIMDLGDADVSRCSKLVQLCLLVVQSDKLMSNYVKGSKFESVIGELLMRFCLNLGNCGNGDEVLRLFSIVLQCKRINVATNLLGMFLTCVSIFDVKSFDDCGIVIVVLNNMLHFHGHAFSGLAVVFTPILPKLLSKMLNFNVDSELSRSQVAVFHGLARLVHTISQFHSKSFVEISPFLLASFLEVYSENMNLTRKFRSFVIAIIYDCIDMCDKDVVISTLSVNFDAKKRDLLKSLYADYFKFYKYSGYV